VANKQKALNLEGFSGSICAVICRQTSVLFTQGRVQGSWGKCEDKHEALLFCDLSARDNGKRRLGLKIILVSDFLIGRWG
jgi:hypothetical protein